ncbi:MAG: hypothetical protein CMQ49_01025 [Gammaproteobacteria bacterium]|nr:hypothetical protein [Gammaproteobacteria bacterium]|tara:strand:- start:382 stop:783 length:402 start_codon:yes stop_codon:yes gene_type:complete
MALDRIDVLLNVTDVERSLGFYRELVGMHVDGTWADDEGRTRWAKLVASGGSALMLNEPEGDALTDRASRPAYRDVVVYVRMRSLGELDAIRARLTDSGAAPGENSDEMYGQREFMVRDPDGYELAVCAPLGS